MKNKAKNNPKVATIDDVDMIACGALMIGIYVGVIIQAFVDYLVTK